MKNTKIIGDWGEDAAAKYLVSCGYEIIDRNWRTRFGEIDIIAKDGATLVFVEVKAKGDGRYGAPLEMITPRKLRKIKNTALYYIKEENYPGPWRIDAAAIEDNKIEVVKNITL